MEFTLQLMNTFSVLAFSNSFHSGFKYFYFKKARGNALTIYDDKADSSAPHILCPVYPENKPSGTINYLLFWLTTLGIIEPIQKVQSPNSDLEVVGGQEVLLGQI